MIVEYHTPQLATENDQRIIARIHELWNQQREVEATTLSHTRLQRCADCNAATCLTLMAVIAALLNVYVR